MAAKTGANLCYEDPKWDSLPRWEAKAASLIDHQLADGAAAEPALRQTVNRYTAAGLPGEFQVIAAGSGWCVAPLAGSPLDTPVSFPEQPRTLAETVRLVVSQVRQRTGVQIESGAPMIPLSIANREIVIGASNEPARNVLLRVPAPPRITALSWALHYAPRAGYSLSWGIVVSAKPAAQGAK